MGRVIVLLALAIATVQAGPLKTVSIDSQCSQSCTGNGKLNYQVGRTYKYRYDSEIQSAIVGAMEDHSALHMSSNVEMEILSKCEIVMKITDVSLTEYDQEDKIMKSASSEFKEGLERYPVRISFQDGNVEELCLTKREPEWVVNAKRGILSLFQANMADFTKNETLKETDVSGTCDTEYYAKEENWYTTDFGKSKKLHSCTDRHSLNSMVQGVPYTANSEYQSMPIVMSEHNCEYKVDKQSHHITSVHCRESHMFRPFSKENSGAVTTNDQRLEFIESTRGISRSGPSIKKVSLKFNHNNGEGQESNSKKDLTQKLREICDKTELGVRPETPRLFTELVYIVKSADMESLNLIYTMLEKGTICKDNKERTSKFFLDTLPLAGTGAALNLMVKLLTSQTVTGIEADMWITSLSFIKNPDSSILTEVKPLINMKGNEDKTLLSIGTLIHSYCSHNECQNDRIVRALLSAIQNKMAPRCKVSDSNYRTTLMSLRAIGNAGFAQSAVPYLDMCMKIQSNPIEIRLSAIDAYRRIPCTASRNSLFNILKDVEEDSEVRIAAYKSIMECPTEETLNSIRKTLEKEEVNQVGSYIWSHLTNLMETSDRHKQGIKEILEDETFKREFDLDMMKFSRNYEKSMFVEPINTGATIEGDVIFSPKSFLPRSSMLNLTVDLFGQSVNLMEFGGRVEGLEYFFEAFIGPNGYFGDAASQKSESTRLAMKSVRQDKIKKIDKRFGTEAEKLRASLYMRVFGNELKYYNFRGIEELLTGPEFNIIEFFTQIAKDNDVTYSYSTMFLDNSIVIPTGSGFPMNLTVNGTSTIDLKLKGKVDLKNQDISGYIKPSAAIDISSMMSVDAFVTKCGIKMVSTLHTSTSVQGKLQLSPSGTLTAEYEMPQNKMEVFDFKTSFFTVHRHVEREQRMIEDNPPTKRMCSPSNLVTITGLELCTEISYPNASLLASGPYFPFTGPVSGGLYLYNRDTHTKYTLNARSSHTKAVNMVQFTFDTPGSKIKRHVSLNVNLDKKDMSLEMNLASPWLDSELEGLILNTKKTKGFTGRLNIDGSKTYSVKAKIDREFNPKTKYSQYKPSIQITTPGNKPIDIRASVQTKSVNLLAVDFNMDGVLRKPVEAKFQVKNAKAMKSVTGSLQMGNHSSYSFASSLGINSFGKKRLFKPLISVRTPTSEVLAFGGSVNHIFGKKVDYSLILDKVVKKKVTLKGNFQKLTYRRGRVLYGVKVDLKSAPMDVFILSKVDNKNFRSVSTKLNFNYINRGVLINGVSRNGIQFASKINNLSSASLTKATGSMNLVVKKNPEYNLKMKGNVDHKSKLTLIFADINYGKNFKDKSKQIDFDFKMNRDFKSLIKGNADLTTKFRFPELNVNLVFTGSHSHSDRHVDSSVYLKGGRTFVIDSGLHWKDDTKNFLAMSGNYTLTYPGRNFIFKESIVQKSDTTYVFKTELQPQKNTAHSAVTELIVPARGSGIWKAISDITLQSAQPIHLEGMFNPDQLDFVTKASYERGSKKFAGSVVSKTTSVASDLKVDVEYPERLVSMNINGKIIKDKYSGFADFKWDAAKDASKKVRASFLLDEPTESKVNGSVSLSYPSRDLTFNLLHQVGSKYSTHADFQWEKNKKISADTTLGIKDKSVICTGKLSTPFTVLPTLGVKLSHKEDNEEYLTKVNVDYSVSESVNMELKLKKPLSLKTFVGYFLTTSSIKGMKRARMDFDHKLNPMNKIDTMVKFLLNKQQVQANFELTNTTKGNKAGFKGDLTLKTTFPYMKKGTISLSHSNNGMTFNTAGTFQRNKKSYKLTSKISHAPSAGSYAGTGKIDMSGPSGEATFNWNHKLSTNSILSSTTAAWGKKGAKQLTLKLNGNTKDMTLGINLETPFKSTGNLEAVFGLEKDNAPYTASMDLKQNEAEIAALAAFFDHNMNRVEGKSSVRIPALNINSRISSKHMIDQNGMTTEFQAAITPEYVVELNSLMKMSKSEPFSHTVLFESSFDNLKRVMYTAELQQEQMNTFITRLEYGTKPVMEFQTNYLLQENEKQVHFLLKTPYEHVQVMSGDFNFAGSADKFKSDTSFEIVPVLKKKSASLSLDMTQGVRGKAEMDTIFLRYPTVSMEVNANMNREESDVSVRMSVQATPYVNLKLSHDMKTATKKSMSASVGYMTSSYGVTVDNTMKDDLIKSDVSLYNNNKKYAGAALQFKNGTKKEGLLVISPPGKRDVELLLTLDGPFTHFEMSHNRQNHFTYDMELSSSPTYKMDVRSSWKIAYICQDDYKSQMMFELVPNQKIMTNGFFTKSSIGKSEFDILFDTAHAIEGNVVIKSPLMKNIKASLTHTYGSKYFDSKATLYHGGKEVVGGSASLNFESSIVGDITLRSAFTKKIQGNVRYDGQRDNFVINMEGSYGKNSTSVELSSKVDTGVVQQKISITSTLTHDLSMEISHLGAVDRFTSFGEINYGINKHRLDVSYENDDKLDWSASLTSPLVHPINSRVTVTGNPNNFKGHVELIRNSDRSDFNVEFDIVSPRKSGSIDMMTPYMKDFSVVAVHTGSLANVNSFIRLTVDKDDVYDGIFTLGMEPSFESSLIINTPANKVEGLVRHEGPANNFKSHAEFTYNADRSEFDVTFKSLNEIAGLISLKSSYFPKDISVSFEHNGQPKNFKSHAEYMYGMERSRIAMELNVLENVFATMSLTVPETPMETITFRHTGDVKNFNTHVEYMFGVERSIIDATVTSTSKLVTSSVTLQSPHTQDFKVSMKHEGEQRNFVTTGLVSHGDQKSEATVKLDLDNQEASVEMISPTYSLNFTHAGTPSDFKSSFDLENEMDRYTGMVNLFVGETVDFNVEFTSPIPKYETILAMYKHTGSPRNFQCHAELVLPDGKSEGDLKVDVSDRSDMSLTFDLTPATRFDLKPMKGVYILKNKVNQPLFSEMIFNYGKDENRMEITLKPTYGQFLLKSAHTPAIRTDYEMTKGPSSFVGKSKLVIDDIEKGHVFLSIDAMKDIDVVFSVKAPSDEVPKVNGELSLAMTPTSIKDSYSIFVDDLKKGGLDLTVDLDNKIEGSLAMDLLTDRYVIDMTLTKDDAKYAGRSDVNINGVRKAGFVSSLDLENGIVTSLAVDLPFTNYSRIDVDFHFKGDLPNFELLALFKNNNEELFNLDGKFSSTHKFSGDFSLTSAACAPKGISFDIEGSLKDFTFSGSLTNNREEVFSSSTEFYLSENPLVTRGSVRVNVFKFAYNLETTANSIKSFAELSDKTLGYAIEATLSNSEDIVSSVIVTEKPYISPSIVDSDRIKNIIELKMSLGLKQKITGDFSLKTPFEKMLQTELNFMHTGEFPLIHTSVDLRNNNNQIFKVSANIKEGEISLVTPFEGFEKTSVTFYHEGNLDIFRTGGTIVYDSGKVIKADIEHMLNGNTLSSRFSLTSMYTGEIVLTAYHNGAPTDFLSKYALMMGSDNKFVCETSFKVGDTALEFHTTTTTTMSGETMVQKANLLMNGTPDNFNTEVSVENLCSVLVCSAENKNKVIRLETSFKNGPILEGSAKLVTPFESYEEMKVSFSHRGSRNNFVSKCEVQYMPRKVLSGEIEMVNKGWTKMDTTVVIKTPFDGIEESKFVYKHSGDSNSLQCDPVLSIGYDVMSGTIKASKSPLSMSVSAQTPFEGYRSLGFDSNLQINKKGRYSTRIETRWGQQSKVIFDGEFSSVNNRIQGSASLTTPFEEIRRATATFVLHDMPTKVTQTFLATFNEENLVDFEVDFNLRGENKHFLTIVRSPQPMKVEISGDFSPMAVDMDAIANFNTADSKSEMKMEASYDLRFTTKKADFKLTRSGQIITYKGEFSLKRSKSDLSWGISSAEKTGFDFILNKNDANLKLHVPGENARVLELNGLYNNELIEGEFLWDADVDRSKKFGARAVFTDRTNTLKGAISIFVPALQRTIQIESDVSVFRGRVIFDGKLSFSFSRDERKKVVWTARVEDLAVGRNAMNYSMTFGLTQPYTNIGIHGYSHLGKENSHYTGVMGMKYLTGKREIKTFHMGGEMDTQRNVMCFEMVNPLKTLNISSSVKTQNGFQVSFVNKYDQKKALKTEFTVDPSKRFIDFHVNYDLQNPMNELQMHAEYVNSSAVQFEVSRAVNYKRITDVLATARLNNSHLLHSRLHWRPEMGDDLQAYYDTKMSDYKKRMQESAFDAGEGLLEEVYDKSTAIHSMIEGEIGQDNMKVIEDVFSPAQFYIVTFVNRAIIFIESAANSTRTTYNSVTEKYQSLSQKTEEAMNTFKSPFMMPVPMDQPFNYAIEMANLPAKHLPGQSVEALKYARHILPEGLNSRIDSINKNWDLEGNYKSTVETFIKMVEKEIEKELLKLKEMITIAADSPLTVYDPKHGEIQAEFHLPIPLRSLDVMPVINFIRYYEMLKEKSQGFSVQLPEMSGEWLPPFTGTAMVSQGKKITTFDGFTYDLDNDCTFILTKDYRDGNFTIIRSNGDEPSITILSQSKPVELKLTGEVFVGGEAVELPVSNGMITVSQAGEIITINSNDFNMLFNTNTDLLTVKINGWYFGKTGGLLGSYDNEPSNDFMTSFGKVIGNGNRFAKTWEVGTATCR